MNCYQNDHWYIITMILISELNSITSNFACRYIYLVHANMHIHASDPICFMIFIDIHFLISYHTAIFAFIIFLLTADMAHVDCTIILKFASKDYVAYM